jgi:microcystin degradation protein MlrC
VESSQAESRESVADVITGSGQTIHLGQFTSLGIDPTRYRTVAVKSMQHFRAAFESIAREVVLVGTGVLCSEIYTRSCSAWSAARSGPSTRSKFAAPSRVCAG